MTEQTKAVPTKAEIDAGYEPPVTRAELDALRDDVRQVLHELVSAHPGDAHVVIDQVMPHLPPGPMISVPHTGWRPIATAPKERTR